MWFCKRYLCEVLSSGKATNTKKNLLELPASIDKTFPHAKQKTYLNVRTLLQIFFTIPWTTASVE